MVHISKAKGFTLIELIIVIVILGILAVVALPKFIDISSDAKIKHTELTQVIKSVMEMARLKCIADDSCSITGNSTLTVGTQTISMQGGYPSPIRNGIGRLVDAPQWGFGRDSHIAFFMYPGTGTSWGGPSASDCIVAYRWNGNGSQYKPHFNDNRGNDSCL